MKKLIVYYLLIISPLFVLVVMAHQKSISSGMFVLLLFAYTLVYRPVVDAWRLINKGILSRKTWWKIYSPFAHVKWFKDLYWRV